MFRLLYESLNFMLLGLHELVNSNMDVQIYHLLYILHSPHINKLYIVEHTPTLVSCTQTSTWTGRCFSGYVKQKCDGVTNIYQATTAKQYKCQCTNQKLKTNGLPLPSSSVRDLNSAPYEEMTPSFDQQGSSGSRCFAGRLTLYVDQLQLTEDRILFPIFRNCELE